MAKLSMAPPGTNVISHRKPGILPSHIQQQQLLPEPKIAPPVEDTSENEYMKKKFMFSAQNA